MSIDRPDVHNAFNEVLIEELTNAFKQINNSNNSSSSSTNYRSIILSGKGASFSAGADLNWMKKMVTYTKVNSTG